MTIEKLKALGYDQLVELERIQNNLRMINQEIVEKSKALPVEKIKEKK